MASSANINIRSLVAATAVGMLVAAATFGTGVVARGQLGFVSDARAESTGTGGGKGQQGPVDKGQGTHGQQGGMGATGSGQGGPSPDSDAKGPRYGGGGSQPDPGTQGGKPAWAQEGIPSDLELGRLNVARSPSHVIDRALAEALLNIDPALYSLPTLDAVVAAILAETYPRIDSPLENLGLYRDLVTDGMIGDGTKITVTDANYTLLAAIFIGSASDKNLVVSEDTVKAIDTVMGLTLPAGITEAEIADMADQIRVAILTAHDS